MRFFLCDPTVVIKHSFSTAPQALANLIKNGVDAYTKKKVIVSSEKPLSDAQSIINFIVRSLQKSDQKDIEDGIETLAASKDGLDQLGYCLSQFNEEFLSSNNFKSSIKLLKKFTIPLTKYRFPLNPDHLKAFYAFPDYLENVALIDGDITDLIHSKNSDAIEAHCMSIAQDTMKNVKKFTEIIATDQHLQLLIPYIKSLLTPLDKRIKPLLNISGLLPHIVSFLTYYGYFFSSPDTSLVYEAIPNGIRIIIVDSYNEYHFVDETCINQHIISENCLRAVCVYELSVNHQERIHGKLCEATLSTRDTRLQEKFRHLFSDKGPTQHLQRIKPTTSVPASAQQHFALSQTLKATDRPNYLKKVMHAIIQTSKTVTLAELSILLEYLEGDTLDLRGQTQLTTLPTLPENIRKILVDDDTALSIAHSRHNGITLLYFGHSLPRLKKWFFDQHITTTEDKTAYLHSILQFQTHLIPPLTKQRSIASDIPSNTSMLSIANANAGIIFIALAECSENKEEKNGYLNAANRFFRLQFQLDEFCQSLSSMENLIDPRKFKADSSRYEKEIIECIEIGINLQKDSLLSITLIDFYLSRGLVQAACQYAKNISPESCHYALIHLHIGHYKWKTALFRMRHQLAGFAQDMQAAQQWLENSNHPDDPISLNVAHLNALRRDYSIHLNTHNKNSFLQYLYLQQILRMLYRKMFAHLEPLSTHFETMRFETLAIYLGFPIIFGNENGRFSETIATLSQEFLLSHNMPYSSLNTLNEYRNAQEMCQEKIMLEISIDGDHQSIMQNFIVSLCEKVLRLGVFEKLWRLKATQIPRYATQILENQIDWSKNLFYALNEMIYPAALNTLVDHIKFSLKFFIREATEVLTSNQYFNTRQQIITTSPPQAFSPLHAPSASKTSNVVVWAKILPESPLVITALKALLASEQCNYKAIKRFIESIPSVSVYYRAAHFLFADALLTNMLLEKTSLLLKLYLPTVIDCLKKSTPSTENNGCVLIHSMMSALADHIDKTLNHNRADYFNSISRYQHYQFLQLLFLVQLIARTQYYFLKKPHDRSPTLFSDCISYLLRKHNEMDLNTILHLKPESSVFDLEMFCKKSETSPMIHIFIETINFLKLSIPPINHSASAQFKNFFNEQQIRNLKLQEILDQHRKTGDTDIVDLLDHIQYVISMSHVIIHQSLHAPDDSQDCMQAPSSTHQKKFS